MVIPRFDEWATYGRHDATRINILRNETNENWSVFNFGQCFQALANASATIGCRVEGFAAQADALSAKGEQNMKAKLNIYALAALTLINGTQAQSRADNAVPVSPENFIRAETDRYFGKIAKNGSFGKFIHNREFGPIDKQSSF